MRKRLLTLGIALSLALIAVPEIRADVETPYLIIRDVTGSMPAETFETLVKKVERTFAEVLKFWSAGPRIEEWGKIIVEFEKPLPNAFSSVFLWGKEKGKRARIVKVYGGGESPHLLAHKLTSAVFPNSDKLVRNMMGEASEVRFGNPISFPMCGYTTDDWVLALLQIRSNIPLAKLGPDHGDWGMEMRDGVPRVRDRAKQHTCYAEAGSFGGFLMETYGVDKMKLFNRLSSTKPRPWEATFGRSLEKLESDWLEAVKSKRPGRENQVTILVKLLQKNPVKACDAAQDIAGKK
jgi:hypothetical protein